jgi:hypothetical protein
VSERMKAIVEKAKARVGLDGQVSDDEWREFNRAAWEELAEAARVHDLKYLDVREPDSGTNVARPPRDTPRSRG